MSSARTHGMASYRIRLRGHLDATWASAFGGMSVTCETEQDRATTLLSGSCDQAALHAILARIRDMGLEILLVEQAPPTGSGGAREPSNP